jgi:hypothetical protein
VAAKRLIEIKARKRSTGLNVKEMMVEDGEWNSFVEDCVKDGEDPETEASGLEELVRNAG